MKKVFRRFVNIWKLDFLATFFAKEKNNNKTTILFWIFSSLLLVIITSIAFFLFVLNTSDDVVDAIEKYVPDGAQVSINDGRLSTQNIGQPFLKEIKTQTKNNSGFEEKVIIVVDTQGNVYDDAVLDGYDRGIAIFGKHALIKNAIQTQEFSFANIQNLEISKSSVIDYISNSKKFKKISFQLTLVLFVVLTVWLLIGRLIFAFWWALMLFVLMRIMERKEGYIVAYKAVLNLYFIPSIVVIFLWFFGINVPLLTTVIFMTLFVANLIWLRKQPEKIQSIESKQPIIDKKTGENIPTKTTKK